MCRLLSISLLLVLASACGDDGGGATDAGGTGDAAAADGAVSDGAPIDGGVAAEPALYYWGDFETNNDHRVARVDLESGEAGVLSLEGLDGGPVDAVAASPDGTRIAVAARNESGGTLFVSLYAADGSGAPTVLASGTRGDENVGQVAFSPDGARVAFIADLDLNGAAALYVAAADGTGEPALVSHAPAEDQRVDRFLWVDDDHIVFAGDTVTDQVTGVYAVDVTAASPLPAALVPMNQLADGQEMEDLLGVDAQGRAYFVGDYQVDDLFRLYRADLDGQNLEQVPGTGLQDGEGDEAPVGSFALSPDGQSLAFSSAAPEPTLFEVYALDLSGASAVQVSGVGAEVPPGGATGPTRREPLVFTDDGSSIGAIADWQVQSGDSIGDFAAFVLPAEAPAGGVRVVAPAPGSADVDQLALAPDGRLFVLGDLVDGNDVELYEITDTTAADQDPSAVLLQDVPQSGDVFGFALTP